MGIDRKEGGLDVPRRAVFLDRDGVLNEPRVVDGKPYPPASADELVLVPGVAAALRELKRNGFHLLVVTNQPDVARGKVTRESVEAIHAALQEQLPLDRIYACYHDDADRCACRKPGPGMLLEGAKEFQVALGRSFLVGDRWRDIDAGHAAGCSTILFDRDYDERLRASPDFRARDWSAILDWILRSSSRHPNPIKKLP